MTRAILTCSLLTATALLSACKTGPKVKVETKESPTGTVIIESVTLEATVQAIDAETREVTLKPKYQDEVRVFRASKDAAHFDQIQVGDHVEAHVVEEFAIHLIEGGEPSSVGVAALGAISAGDTKPAAVLSATREITAEIVGIDAKTRHVTLKFLGGESRQFKVGDHIDLTRIALGDSVRIQVTEAIGISVAKPSKKD